MEGNYVIRKAETKDVGDIFKMASRVAIDHSERMTVDVRTVTKEDFADNLSKGWYECIVLVYNGNDEEECIVGYAIFSYCFSTWTGRMAYLDEIYVSPEHRGNGQGLRLIRRVAKIAHGEGCKGMKWIVFRWNKLAKKFYSKIKADNLTESDKIEFMSLKGDQFFHLVQGPCNT